MSQVTTNVIEKVSYTHDAMIDLLIAKPMVSQGDVARHFGFTPGWVSRVIRSDAFRERLASRKGEIVDPMLLQQVEDRFQSLVERSLEILMEKLDANPTADLALKAAELGARSLGYGVAKNVQQNNTTFVVAMPEKAISAEEWIKQHAPMHIPQVIDVPAA